jgi:transposase
MRRDRTRQCCASIVKRESDARIARHILAIANALDGMSREEVAKSAGMDRQTLRHWVIRYNEHGLDGHRSSTPRRRASSSASCSPAPIWRRAAFRHLRARIWCAFVRSGSSVHVTSIGRILRELGLSCKRLDPVTPKMTRPHKRPLKRGQRCSKNSVNA